MPDSPLTIALWLLSLRLSVIPVPRPDPARGHDGKVPRRIARSGTPRARKGAVRERAFVMAADPITREDLFAAAALVGFLASYINERLPDEEQVSEWAVAVGRLMAAKMRRRTTRRAKGTSR